MEHRTWGLQEARDHFSEVVELAATEGPQTVTRHGKPVAQVVPFRQQPGENRKSGRSLYEVLRSCPHDLGAVIPKRDRSPSREIDLS